MPQFYFDLSWEMRGLLVMDKSLKISTVTLLKLIIPWQLRDINRYIWITLFWNNCHTVTSHNTSWHTYIQNLYYDAIRENPQSRTAAGQDGEDM